MTKTHKRAKGVLRVLLVLLLLPIAGEGLLWVHVQTGFHGQTIFQPNRVRGRNPNPKYLSGISGESRFTTNALGLRGRMPKVTDDFVVVFGNSTSECVWLDDRETWAEALQIALNERGGREKRVTVNIAARSGLLMAHSRVQLEHLASQKPAIKMALLMQGSTDMARAFRHETLTALTAKELQAAFANPIVPWEGFPDSFDALLLRQYWKQGEKRITRGFRSELGLGVSKGRDGSSEMEARRNYAANQKLTVLSAVGQKQFKAGLSEYRRQVQGFVETCLAKGITPVLLSQPVLYGRPFPAEYEAYYVSDNPSPEFEVCSPALLFRLLGEYARVTGDVAREHDVPYINLYDALYGQLDCFHDQVHLNEEGAKKVAEIVVDALSD
jgi:lysophospholipase L1-like esterase